MKNRAVIAALCLLGATAVMAQPQSTTLEIAGMDCAACPITVRVALERVPGAVRAKVDYARKLAVVEFDGERTSPAALARASTEAGFPATVKAQR